MLSLLITAFLGFFCCSSVNYNTLVHTKEKDKNIQRNAITITTGDDGKVKEAVYCTSDFLSYELFTNFLTSVVVELNQSNMALNDSSSGSYRFSNIVGSIVSFETSNLLSNLVTINRMQLDKSYLGSYTIDGATVHKAVYYITLQNNSTNIVQFKYDLLGPIGFVPSITSSITIINSSYIPTGSTFGYRESNYTSVAPFTIYAYQPYFNEIIVARELYGNLGYDEGYNIGFNDGKVEGRQIGYNEGLIDGASYDDTALTIFTGIIDVGLLPINIFLQILNFDLFGVNVAGFVSALLTVSLVIIIIRIVVGSKNG